MSDAGELHRNYEEESALELVKRSLAPNKDILTSAELERLVNDYNGTYNIIFNALSVIFCPLLKSRDRKALLLVDEHRKLFGEKPYVPDKFRSLVPLSSYYWWGEGAKGSRVGFTGTAHAKYELEILEDSYRLTSVVFVGPLSRYVFSKLLDTYPPLAVPAIREGVIAIKSYILRELVHLSAAIKDLRGPIAIGDLQKCTESQIKAFLLTAKTYYESRSPFRMNDAYKVLVQMFLGSSSTVDFEWNFLDLGLIYRSKVFGEIGTQHRCNDLGRMCIVFYVFITKRKERVKKSSVQKSMNSTQTELETV